MAYFAWRNSALAHLNRIADALARAAAPDCKGNPNAPPPISGLVLEQADQFAAEDLAQLGLTNTDSRPRVLTVAPGSTLARAGLASGDTLALWPADRPPFVRHPGFGGIEAAARAMRQARAAPDSAGMWHIPIERNGHPRDLAVPAVQSCAAWIDLRQSVQAGAHSNPNWIQLTDAMMRQLETDDDALAFVIGHELGHQVLRLSSGRDAPCGESCEEAADRLSLHYMARAGYNRAGATRALTMFDNHSDLIAMLIGRHGALRARIDAIAALPSPATP